MVEEVAHEGLVLYPTREHAERCQARHTEDYMNSRRDDPHRRYERQPV